MLLDPAAKLISVTEENTEVKLINTRYYIPPCNCPNDRNFPVVSRRQPRNIAYNIQKISAIPVSNRIPRIGIFTEDILYSPRRSNSRINYKTKWTRDTLLSRSAEFMLIIRVVVSRLRAFMLPVAYWNGYV
jgi:hypothetical protein